MRKLRRQKIDHSSIQTITGKVAGRYLYIIYILICGYRNGKILVTH